MIKTFMGHFINGDGHASVVTATPERQALLTRVLGAPMLGTFNVETNGTNRVPWHTKSEGKHRYTLVKLINDEHIFYAWSYNWDGSKLSMNRMELYSKELIPDSFKSGEFRIEFCKPLNRNEIAEWASCKGNNYWFQGFEWLPNAYQRADSALVWNVLKYPDYKLKRVLEIGCHTAYHSFQASKAGAIVDAYDNDAKIVNKAIQINDYIEQTDVNFSVRNDMFLQGYWDYIFYLSVHHQMDPTYAKLKETIKALKLHTDVLFLELINPPLKGGKSEAQIDKLVGGEKLLRYKHKVRKMRTVYRIS